MPVITAIGLAIIVGIIAAALESGKVAVASLCVAIILICARFCHERVGGSVRQAAIKNINMQSKETPMTDFVQYRRKQIAELTHGYRHGRARHQRLGAGQGQWFPKAGDMIARNPKNHADQWLVAAQYFADNFEPIT